MDVETKLKISATESAGRIHREGFAADQEIHETAADAAKAYKVNLEETAADSLAQLYGPEAANGHCHISQV